MCHICDWNVLGLIPVNVQNSIGAKDLVNLVNFHPITSPLV